MTTEERKKAAEDLVKKFQVERVLNQDQAGRRVSLLGSVNSHSGILIVERAAFPSEKLNLSNVLSSISNVQNLGANDIYSWHMAWCGKDHVQPQDAPDLKVNLIHPCTEKHIKKYSSQQVRNVTESPQIYREHILPYIRKNREEGRLNWVYNIIEGRTEQEDVIFRKHSKENEAPDEGFLLLPDLNWDRKTITSLHLLALVERRDIWSIRDLTKKHVIWLKHMHRKLLDATTELYPEIEKDQLKLYMHYQPTYHHFHIHIVHVMLESGSTQAVGKAFGLENVISQLETMDHPEKGMKDLSLTYFVGEASEIWLDIFEPLKSGTLALEG